MRCQIITIVLALALSSCTAQPASPAGSSALPDILTTSTILADIARKVAGDRLVIESLLPAGADPHSYQPTPQDTAKISATKVLIVNGAEYEHFLEPLLENAGGQRVLIEASTGLCLRTGAAGEHTIDPHLWLDPNNVIAYTENIRDGLTEFDPRGAETYRSSADTYIEQLRELDAWIEGLIAQIPPQRRVLVTNHEAFGYFAERYGFTVIGAIVESFSSDASPSAQQIAGLIDQIRQSGAPAIFLDASDSPALAQQIAAETGVQVVTDLHLESLTEGAPAGTYIDMIRYNVTRIIQALR